MLLPIIFLTGLWLSSTLIQLSLYHSGVLVKNLLDCCPLRLYLNGILDASQSYAAGKQNI